MLFCLNIYMLLNKPLLGIEGEALNFYPYFFPSIFGDNLNV